MVEPIPTATQIPVPCPAIPTGWVEVMNDKFGPNIHMWPLGRETDAYANRNVEIKNGALRFLLAAHQGFYTFYNPEYIDHQQDFHLHTKVRHTNGPLHNNYGVTFRSNGLNHYYFAINNAGEIQIYKHIDSEDSSWGILYYEDPSWEILYYAVSSNIQADQYNEMVVFAQGSHFTFCVNQQMVAEINDDSYVSGDVGIGMSLEQSNDEAVIEYDNYTIYGPKK